MLLLVADSGCPKLGGSPAAGVVGRGVSRGEAAALLDQLADFMAALVAEAGE